MIITPTMIWWMMVMVPLISIFDYQLFSRYTRCTRCGNQATSYYTFIVPTLIEFLLFIAGVYVGSQGG